MNHCKLPDKLLPRALHNCLLRDNGFIASLPNFKSARGRERGAACWKNSNKWGWEHIA